MAVSPVQDKAALRRRGDEEADGGPGSADPKRRRLFADADGPSEAVDAVDAEAALPAKSDGDEVERYAAAVTSAYATAAAREKLSVSMNALEQPPRNAEQQAVYQRYIQFCVKMVQFLIEHNAVLLPGSFIWQFLNLSHFSVDDQNAHIYFEELLRKIGLTGLGELRIDGYEDQFEKQQRGVDPSLVSCIGVDNLSIELQQELTRLILEGLAEFVPEGFPKTIRELLKMEMLGLPAMAQIFFHAMSKSAAECDIVGGAIQIQSFLRRLYLCILESGLQEYLKQNGFSIDLASICHECVNGNLLGLFLYHDNEVNEDVDRFLGKFSPAEQVQIVQSIIQLWEESSWPPGSLPGTEGRIQTTPLFLDTIFGKGMSKDSSPRPPVPNPTRSADCYAHWKYTGPQKVAAVGSKMERVATVEKDGGGGALDTDEVNMEGVGGVPLVEYIMARRPFGEEGPRWYLFHTYENVTVLKLDAKDCKLRLLFVHGPPCNANDSRPGVQYDGPKLQSMLGTGKSLQWLKVVVHIMGTPNSVLITDKSLDRPIRQNFVFVVADLIHNGQRFHLSPKACSAFLKNIMYPDGNIFDPLLSGLLKKGYFDIVSKNGRNQVLRTGGVKADVRRDNFFGQTIARMLSRAPAGDEEAFGRLLHEAVEVVLKQDSRDGSTMTPSAVSERRKIFFDMDIIRGDALEAFTQVCDRLKQNSGNTKSNRKASSEAVKTVDVLLEEFVESRRKFFVLIEGTAGDEAKLPADGTDMKLSDGSVLTFDIARYVPITLNGLRERTKPDNTKGNTGAQRSVKVSDYSIEVHKGMVKYSGGTVSEGNRYNVVEVFLKSRAEAAAAEAAKKAAVKATKPHLRQTIKRNKRNTAPRGLCKVCKTKPQIDTVCGACTHPTDVKCTQIWICKNDECYKTHMKTCEKTHI